MKRILFLSMFVALLCMQLVSHAQQISVVKSADDTLVNADTTHILVNAPDDAKSIQVVVTRQLGTAAGRAVLKVSNDGKNFLTIGADTLTFTNAVTNAKTWVLSPLYYGQYYIELISSGTTRLTAKGYLCRRKT